MSSVPPTTATDRTTMSTTDWSTTTMSDLTHQLTRTDLDRTQRLTRLQGWRGEEAEAADRARWAQRLAPAGCAVGALVGGILGSPVIVTLFAVTALAGTFTPNHVIEAAWNHVAWRQGLPVLPANRAAKRLGCAMGFLQLGTAALLLALGHTTAGAALAIVFGLLALFVAATGICVPSVVFTLAWGAERGTSPSLVAAARG
jgi:hypothetical protein